MPKGGGNWTGRALSMRPNAKACMKPSRDSITAGGPATPCSASSAACRPSREAWPACRRLMSAPPLTKANRPAELDAAIPMASDNCCRVRPRSLPVATAAPNTALAPVGVAGARDRDRDLIAGDHRLDQRPAAGACPVADRKDGRHHRAAGMHRALAEAVVEL